VRKDPEERVIGKEKGTRGGQVRRKLEGTSMRAQREESVSRTRWLGTSGSRL
jgi:hypothetical protein